jgi:site-specific DNA-methyltransferase (adenine-specific)
MHSATPFEQTTHHFMDGRAFLSNLPEGSVATAFFDPQYRGVMDKMSYGNEGARQIERAKLAQMPDEMITEFVTGIHRVLKPQGHLFLWVDKFHLCQGIQHWLSDTKFEIVDMITWNKQKMGMGYRSRRVSEYLMVLQRPPKRVKGAWTRHDIRDVWDEKLPKGNHPHRKPIGLQTALIEATTRPGDLIIDPAAGSFSVLEAALSVGERRFSGADLVDHRPATSN